MKSCARLVATIVSEAIGVPMRKLTRDSPQAGSEAWDAVTHLMIFDEIERRLRVSFATHEIENAINIGDIIDLTDHKFFEQL